MSLNAPDLTQRPPRSPRVRLGGYAILPRMLDKGRAVLAGTQGEYKYACGLDEEFLQFTGVDPVPLSQELAAGKSDTEILDWIQQHATKPRTGPEILAWSQWEETRGPVTPDMRSWFNEVHAKLAPTRTDIIGWFDLLDLDDYASFGGKA